MHIRSIFSSWSLQHCLHWKLGYQYTLQSSGSKVSKLSILLVFNPQTFEFTQNKAVQWRSATHSLTTPVKKFASYWTNHVLFSSKISYMPDSLQWRLYYQSMIMSGDSFMSYYRVVFPALLQTLHHCEYAPCSSKRLQFHLHQPQGHARPWYISPLIFPFTSLEHDGPQPYTYNDRRGWSSMLVL